MLLVDASDPYTERGKGAFRCVLSSFFDNTKSVVSMSHMLLRFILPFLFSRVFQ